MNRGHKNIINEEPKLSEALGMLDADLFYVRKRIHELQAVIIPFLGDEHCKTVLQQVHTHLLRENDRLLALTAWCEQRIAREAEEFTQVLSRAPRRRDESDRQ